MCAAIYTFISGVKIVLLVLQLSYLVLADRLFFVIYRFNFNWLVKHLFAVERILEPVFTVSLTFSYELAEASRDVFCKYRNGMGFFNAR